MFVLFPSETELNWTGSRWALCALQALVEGAICEPTVEKCSPVTIVNDELPCPRVGDPFNTDNVPATPTIHIQPHPLQIEPSHTEIYNSTILTTTAEQYNN